MKAIDVITLTYKLLNLFLMAIVEVLKTLTSSHKSYKARYVYSICGAFRDVAIEKRIVNKPWCYGACEVLVYLQSHEQLE